MYKIKKIEAEILTEEYMKNFVNIDYFLDFCKNCPEYKNNWTCPPFDFNPIDIWKKYDNFHIIGLKFSFNKELLDKTYSKEELNAFIVKSFRKEKNKLLEELLEIENNNSLALSAGLCSLCESCAKINNEECIHKDKLRHSIESLGGDVEKTARELLGLEMKWIEDYKLPEYLILVCGILS
ncbi:DUF2284 domain-containing protein [Methanobrevibacter sp. DSM 116169]|uniref:DUF2284 domain-containing protein n=1 Tax=Methanobrevibacter sp. DSM 116169 TaxID=3242727 RepID=UPI0038FC3097